MERIFFRLHAFLVLEPTWYMSRPMMGARHRQSKELSRWIEVTLIGLAFLLYPCGDLHLINTYNPQLSDVENSCGRQEEIFRNQDDAR
ncbi:hypothetical protein BDV24DRAFT_126406 [Aspergillus arachidicola]|uniref:Uncharacterized protein n=1 Tax=Aspergillus arachidicola TaxID=656916 RepID=A0A5N6YHN8_9EURO|nr:hypothetical protein BDV24DRAFT_126406 [Aspergillus arachidicola]